MKKLLIVLVLLSIMIIPKVKLNAAKLPTLVELKSVKSAVLMEVETNTVLYQFNSEEKRAPASMTKIMTMKLVLDAIKNNEFSMDDVLTTSSYASSMGGSQIYLSVNEKMKVSDLFKSMVIASANDAAVVLAEKVSGTESNFTKKMNHQAKLLGCKNTSFQNATGLPTLDHYTTCYDMALMACSLLKEYEDIVIPYSSMYESYIRTDTPNPFWLVNTNKMLKTNSLIDGLKTGWTHDAGYCITTTMKQDGMRLVCVVMGAESPTLRNADAMNLLNYGFANFTIDLITKKGEIMEMDSDIFLEPNKYHIVTSDDVYKVTHKEENKYEIKQEVVIYKDRIKNLETKKIGVLKTYINGNLYLETDLEIVERTKKASFFDVLYTVFKSLF